jgi:hypothetical protein
LLHLWFKGEPFFLAVDIKADLSGSTSMLALAVLKKGLSRIRGVLVSTSMWRTTKSTGTKKSQTLTEMSSAIPAG